jgi:hypothetical protein
MAISHPPFGKADHDSILLIPAYRQRIKQEVPGLRSVQRWSDQSDSTLQDCFHHVDWEMFRIASKIHEYVAMHASNSIIKCADDTTVVGLITNNDETAYREEVRAL